jgi:hypothetical protein
MSDDLKSLFHGLGVGFCFVGIMGFAIQPSYWYALIGVNVLGITLALFPKLLEVSCDVRDNE